MIEYTLRTNSFSSAGRTLCRAAIALLGDYLADKELLYDLDLALTEASANVCRHAYPEVPGTLEIRILVDEGRSIGMEVVDWGKGPDPDQIRLDPPGPDSEGGRGFFLMNQLMDEFAVERRDGKNIIVMRKNVEGSRWQS